MPLLLNSNDFALRVLIHPLYSAFALKSVTNQGMELKSWRGERTNLHTRDSISALGW